MLELFRCMLKGIEMSKCIEKCVDTSSQQIVSILLQLFVEAIIKKNSLVHVNS